MSKRDAATHITENRGVTCQGAILIALGLAALCLSSCREKLTAHTTKGPEPATEKLPESLPQPAIETLPEPPSPALDVPNAFDAARIYYQSRGVITIAPSRGFMGEGDEFSLVNDTSGHVLIERQRLASSLDLLDASTPFSLLLGGYDVIVRLYPADEEVALKFVYGENELKLWAWGGAGERYSATKIKLEDFEIQGGAASSFAEDVQVAGDFHGWLGATTNPVVAIADGALTTGVFNIVND